MKGRWGSYRWLGRIFWVGVAGGLLAGWYYVDRMIPDRVSIVEEEKEDFSFPLPFFHHAIQRQPGGGPGE